MWDNNGFITTQVISGTTSGGYQIKDRCIDVCYFILALARSVLTIEGKIIVVCTYTSYIWIVGTIF